MNGSLSRFAFFNFGRNYDSFREDGNIPLVSDLRTMSSTTGITDFMFSLMTFVGIGSREHTFLDKDVITSCI